MKKLLKTKKLEVRLYAPQKRTIDVEGKKYFLQFPELLVGRKEHNIRKYANLYVGFHKDGKAYIPPFFNSKNFFTCLASYDHYENKVDKTIEDLIFEYWNSSFTNPTNGGRDLRDFRSFNNWQKMNLEQVNNCLESLKSISLESFLKLIKDSKGSHIDL